MTNTRIDITARDSSAGAFSSAERRITALGGSVRQLSSLLGAVGIGFSAIGAARSLTGVINAQDALAKLSRATSVSVETLAGLEFAAGQAGTSLDRAAKGVRAWSRLIVEASEGSAKAQRSINTLGLELENLIGLSPEDQFLKLADAVSKLSEQDRAVAITGALGDRMAELSTLLGQGEDALRSYIQEGREYNPVTREAAEQSERFNDNLDRLGKSFTQIKIQAGNSVIPVLDEIAQKMVDASNKSGVFAGIIAGLGDTLAKLYKSDSFLTAVEFSGPLGSIVSKRARAGIASEAAAQATEAAALSGASKLWLDVANSIDKAGDESDETATQGRRLGQIYLDLNNKQKSARNSSKALEKALKDEEKEIDALKRRAAELTKQFDPLIAKQEKLNELILLRDRGLIDQGIVDKAGQDAVNKYLTAIEEAGVELKRRAAELSKQFDPLIEKQEKLNELTLLRDMGLIDHGIFDKARQEAVNKYLTAIEEAGVDTKQFGQTFQRVFDTNTEIAISGVRRIQSALSDGLFNFFDDGLKGMVNSVKNAVGRIITEFASVRLLQGAGLGALFGASGAAVGAGVTTSSGGLGGLEIASAGLSATSLLSSGFGLTTLAGGGISGLGSLIGSGSFQAFGAGLAGDAVAGLTAGLNAGLTSSSAAGFASAGSAFGAIAAPVAIAAIADIGLRQLFGNKKLGGTAGDILSFVPVVGTLINGLFGLGPEKLRRQVITGNISEEGFNGSFDSILKRKGGLFRGDKVRRETFDEFGELQRLFDESIQGFSLSIRASADNLNLSTKSLDSFNQQIEILSEKGEALTQERISEAIAAIGDTLAAQVLPNFREFAKIGESASAVLTRINSEFNALGTTLRTVGVGSDAANEILNGLSIGSRSAIVSLAGGVDALNAKTAALFDKLDDSDKLEILSEQLQEALSVVGVGFIPTMDQFIDAMTSGRLTIEQFIAGLNLQDLIANVNQLKDASDLASGAVDSVSNSISSLLDGRLNSAQIAFDRLSNSVQAERNKITKQYNEDLEAQNEIINDISASIANLQQLSAQLNSTSTQLQPLSIGAARAQIESAIKSAKNGIFPQAGGLSQALQTIGGQNTAGFSTREDFLRSRAQSASLVSQLGNLVDGQIDFQSAALDSAEETKSELERGFTRQIGYLDGILNSARNRLDELKGINTTLDDILTALTSFNAAAGSNIGNTRNSSGLQFGDTINRVNRGGVGTGTVLSSSDVTGRGSGISDQFIKDFAATNPTAQELSSFANTLGIDSKRIQRIFNISDERAEKFFADNPNIARFHGGGKSSKEGIAIIKRNEVVSTDQHNKDLIGMMGKLVERVEQNTIEVADMVKRLKRTTVQVSDGFAFQQKAVT